jgi:uncharacterized membrane protein
MIGAHVSDRKGPPGAERAMQGSFVGPYGRALSKEDRGAIRQALIARRPSLREKRGEMRRIIGDLAEALRAEPFDPQAVSAILDRQREVQFRLQDTGREVLIERLTEMTPEARAAFADNLEKGMKRMGRR